MRGCHENGDIFFQHREACNKYYDALPAIVEEYMGKVNAKLGTDYQLFNYYGAARRGPRDHRHGLHLRRGRGSHRLSERPGSRRSAWSRSACSAPSFRKSCWLPSPRPARRSRSSTARRNPAPRANPCIWTLSPHWPTLASADIQVIGGRYGLGSKDTPPASVFAVYEELAKSEMKRQFTIGIVDDVTNLSLEEHEAPNTAAEGTIECKFWGLGGDGTVGANKNSIKIIGDHTDKYVQAYFQYDSKKTGGVTISHLRFGDKPIKSPYYINKADFVACHNPSYITKGFTIVRDVKPGGVFMINCQWDDAELAHHLDAASKRYIAKNNIQLYTINAIDLAIQVGMGKRTNTILQSAFFTLAKIMPEEDAIAYMKDSGKEVLPEEGPGRCRYATTAPSTPVRRPSARSRSRPIGPPLPTSATMLP